MSEHNLNRSHVTWVMTDTVVTSGLSIGTLLIVARIVSPDDFGKAAIVLGVTQLANLFVEGLFHDALIQRRDITARIAGAALAFVLTLATALFLLSAGFLAVFPKMLGAEQDWLVVGALFSLLFSGPIGVANALMRRKFDFATVARASVIGKLLGCTVGVAIAVTGGGAFSLIWQYTAGAIFQCALIVPSAFGQLKLNLRFATLGSLLRFAMPYALMHSLVAARLQCFMLVVATLLGLRTAGFVNVAFRFTTTAQLILTSTFSNLTFPLLAAQQDALHPDLAAAFQTSTKLITICAMPAFVGLSLVAADFIPVAMGPGWEATIPLVAVLSAGAAISFLRLSSSFLLRALGYVRFSFWNATLHLVVILGGILLLQPKTALDMVFCWTIPTVIQLLITWAVVAHVARIGWKCQIAPAIPAIVATAVMAAVVLVLSDIVADHAAPIRLAVKTLAGGVTYGLCLLIIDQDIRRIFAQVDASALQAARDSRSNTHIAQRLSCMINGIDISTLDERYRSAAHHTIKMPVAEAVELSRLLARRITERAGKPDIIVGLANGALLTTTICSDELGIPARVVKVRRQASRYKQELLHLREIFRIPNSWMMTEPIRYLSSRIEKGFSKLEIAEESFGFLVRGLHVAVVDDCIVTGRSIRRVADRMRTQGAARVTIAAICWTEEEYGGSMTEGPDVYLHRKIQWYPWSNNSPHRKRYLAWLDERRIMPWT
jgi:O-antigen/teichoic acid export membrane protein/orotate phosphoribosyltransferase